MPTSTSEPSFRVAVADDLETVRTLTEAAYAHFVPVLGAPPLPMTEDYAPRIGCGEVRLAEIDGGVAGVLVLERHADHAMIWSVAVAPDRQGRGLGLALLRLAEHEARGLGLPALRLYTNALMVRNLALYERFGFVETGRRPHPKRAGFVLVDMAYALA